MRTRWAVTATAACLVSQLVPAPAMAAPGTQALTSAMTAAQSLLGIESGTSGNGLTIVSASLTRADGGGAPVAIQSGLFSGMPSGLGMPDGVILSSGTREAALPTAPETPASSVVNGTQSAFPADWYAANSNQVPGDTEPGSTSANDPAMLTIVAVPDGTVLEVDWLLGSEEFSSGEPFNDVALILVDTAYAGTPANPADKNCALLPGESGPVPATTNSVDQAASYFRLDPTYASSGFAATTTPQTCRARVVPGEQITIRFVVWDGGDWGADTALLLGADSLRSILPNPRHAVTDQTTLARLRDKGLASKVTCDAPCSPTVRVTIPKKLANSLDIGGTQVGDNVVIGTVAASLDEAGTETAKVFFTTKTLNKLGRAKPDVVRMKASLVGVAGTTETVAVRIR